MRGRGNRKRTMTVGGASGSEGGVPKDSVGRGPIQNGGLNASYKYTRVINYLAHFFNST
jgi:hypothetical protein